MLTLTLVQLMHDLLSGILSILAELICLPTLFVHFVFLNCYTVLDRVTNEILSYVSNIVTGCEAEFAAAVTRVENTIWLSRHARLFLVCLVDFIYFVLILLFIAIVLALVVLAFMTLMNQDGADGEGTQKHVRDTSPTEINAKDPNLNLNKNVNDTIATPPVAKEKTAAQPHPDQELAAQSLRILALERELKLLRQDTEEMLSDLVAQMLDLKQGLQRERIFRSPANNSGAAAWYASRGLHRSGAQVTKIEEENEKERPKEIVEEDGEEIVEDKEDESF